MSGCGEVSSLGERSHGGDEQKGGEHLGKIIFNISQLFHDFFMLQLIINLLLFRVKTT